ncbi:acyltransferase family protein [Sphingomonas sp. EC-HK361]|uniref:acyltransferase family protein n=1 Tax=Sphingomonas sp. EC-HK361 TaxID=2038397 RepID=UPI0018FED9BB|nr:acyltransferase family protein [Sphingomonas sp. EC-HK361]
MTIGRHYGLDWLRIGAFALLILYHVGMVFAPWDWVVKSRVTYPALIVPMAALTPWRLALLFAVSGYASRRLMMRGDLLAFLRNRSLRLLLPVGFALVVLLPPELWIRERLRGYDGSLWRYWSHDYWSVTPIHGLGFPSWEHMWFVVYLWAYTVALVGLVAALGIPRLQRAGDWLAHGIRLLWVPIAILVTLKLALMFEVPEQQGLTTDWTAHAEFAPLFLFGFVLGGSDVLMPAVHRFWKPAAVIALVTGIFAVWIELAYQGQHVPGHALMALDRAARLAMAWVMILLLVHIATRFWNHDHPWRATLAEAVFPIYVAHHLILMWLAWTTLPLDLPMPVEFALLLGGTTGLSLGVYLIGRRIPWLRPWIGLSAPKRAPAVKIATA